MPRTIGGYMGDCCFLTDLGRMTSPRKEGRSSSPTTQQGQQATPTTPPTPRRGKGKTALLPATIRSFTFHLPTHVQQLEDGEGKERLHREHPILEAVYQRHHILAGSEWITVSMQLSIHPCPTISFLQELKLVFPEVFSAAPATGTSGTTTSSSGSSGGGSAVTKDQLLIVPTFQQCQHDLVASGPDQDVEKDVKLELFYLWAITVCVHLRERGYWADFTDPASGYPALGPRGASFYPDITGANRLLGYELLNSGCCTILSHPKWGTRVYPATLFTLAPLEVLLECMDGIGN